LVGSTIALHRKWRNYKDEHAEYEVNKKVVKDYRKNIVNHAENFTEAAKDLMGSPYSPSKDRYNESLLSRSSKTKSIISTKKFFSS
jgi:hypothetical protein